MEQRMEAVIVDGAWPTKEGAERSLPQRATAFVFFDPRADHYRCGWLPDVENAQRAKPLSEVLELIRSKGVSIEDPDWANGTHYAVDFNNAVLADPYLEGTGYLASEEEAQRVADEVIPLLNELACEYLKGQGYVPGDGEWGRWTHTDPNTYATIVSERREGGDEDGNPAVERSYP